MRPVSALRDYQKEAIGFIVSHRAAMLWLDMGLGKTVSTLTALDWLLCTGEARGVLIVAPLRVCRTVWRQEAAGWEHLRHLQFSLVCGSAAERERAVYAQADVYLINYENLPWLAKLLYEEYTKPGRPLPFDVVVWDEITEMKNSTAKRSKTARTFLPQVKRRIGLTGTPSPKGIVDLHGQYLVLDDGRRLGTTKTSYMHRFFNRGFNGWGYTPLPGADGQVKDLISGITLDMTNSGKIDIRTYTNDIIVELDDRHAKQYRELEREFFIQLDSGEEVEAFNAGALSSKCRQFANGAMYVGDDPSTRTTVTVHDAKLDALQEIIDSTGSPVLVGYVFQSDAARIEARFKGVVNLTTSRDPEAVVEAWNRGDIPILIGHPKSMGHGLNMQYGGHTIAWFGLPWEHDLYDQLNARLARSGQSKPVVVHRILAHKTLDMVVRDTLSFKGDAQTALREAVRNYRR